MNVFIKFTKTYMFVWRNLSNNFPKMHIYPHVYVSQWNPTTTSLKCGLLGTKSKKPSNIGFYCLKLCCWVVDTNSRGVAFPASCGPPHMFEMFDVFLWMDCDTIHNYDFRHRDLPWYNASYFLGRDWDISFLLFTNFFAMLLTHDKRTR